MATATSEYELEREARIRENKAQMQKLGLANLAQSWNQSATVSRGGRRARKPAPTTVKPLPLRRVEKMKPVSYSEHPTKQEKGSKGVKSYLTEKDAKEEVYTEKHEKLLGTCQTAWPYEKHGKRIYDLGTGLVCHQCRQKTLGHRTSCSICKALRGQFCGNCLYMRYGENVLEAKENPNWICPVCRDICNCSACRTKKGWFPTGNAYKKAVKLGHKSVAHYLIATKRSSAKLHDSCSADSSNKLPSDKSETSCISDRDAPVDDNESLEDGETSCKAKVDKDAAGCATPSKPAVTSKRKVIEWSPDCVASRLRSRAHKP